jgi:hypothetical protein
MKFKIQVHAIVKEIANVTNYVRVTYVNRNINFKFKLKKDFFFAKIVIKIPKKVKLKM